jgi:endonuclease/exonuclease/phosphatase family metal-dependent hydrolase
MRPKKEGWRLDYILISKSEIESPQHIQLMKAVIMDEEEGSDHCPVGCTIKILDGKHENADMEESDDSGKKSRPV